MLLEVPRRLNLRRGGLLVSFIVGATVAVSVVVIATRSLLIAGIERDAMLIGWFVESIADLRIPEMTLAGLFGPAHLPEVRRVNLYGPDRVVRWSTEPRLIGSKGGSEHLEAALASGTIVTAGHLVAGGSGLLGSVAVEHYIPLRDEAGRVGSLLEIHKQPLDLLAQLQHSYLVFWLAAMLGGLLICLGLFWMIWRLSSLLAAQQKQLVANETVVALGEMSSAVAHSLRNPLAAIRSSAELVLDAEDAPVRKNLEDIIGQVDRLSKCVSELLIASRPLCGEREAVDPVALVDDVLHAFAHQLRAANIRVDWPAPPRRRCSATGCCSPRCSTA
ncbi:histidine kinase dimerization/phospho-acceptor domain-containing protein [Azotobacter sp. CWF10]